MTTTEFSVTPGFNFGHSINAYIAADGYRLLRHYVTIYPSRIDAERLLMPGVKGMWGFNGRSGDSYVWSSQDGARFTVTWKSNGPELTADNCAPCDGSRADDVRRTSTSRVQK